MVTNCNNHIFIVIDKNEKNSHNRNTHFPPARPAQCLWKLYELWHPPSPPPLIKCHKSLANKLNESRVCHLHQTTQTTKSFLCFHKEVSTCISMMGVRAHFPPAPIERTFRK